MLRFDPFGDASTRPASSGRMPRFMPMDLYKIDDHYVLTADLPGVDPASVDVTVDNGTMTLIAHRSARADDTVQWLSSERFSGTYRRQLSLGDDVDHSRISATHENGVLTVSIPIAERAKARRIEVAHTGADRTDEPTSVDTS